MRSVDWAYLLQRTPATMFIVEGEHRLYMEFRLDHASQEQSRSRVNWEGRSEEISIVTSTGRIWPVSVIASRRKHHPKPHRHPTALELCQVCAGRFSQLKAHRIGQPPDQEGRNEAGFGRSIQHVARSCVNGGSRPKPDLPFSAEQPFNDLLSGRLTPTVGDAQSVRPVRST